MVYCRPYVLKDLSQFTRTLCLPSKPYRGRKSHRLNVIELFLLSMSMARKNQLSIHWIKAHVGHPGNERADTLAKLGTKLPPQGDMGLSPKIIEAEYAQATHDMRQKSWENSDTCRQSQNLAPVSRPHPGILPTQQRKPRPVHPMDHRFLQPNET